MPGGSLLFLEVSGYLQLAGIDLTSHRKLLASTHILYPGLFSLFLAASRSTNAVTGYDTFRDLNPLLKDHSLLITGL